MAVTFIHQTLDHELCALARGASLECLVCGEFVLHQGEDVVCPECGSIWPGLLAPVGAALDSKTQAG
jgi:Zn finger protein HypA/HybF involved in hydrogenase expression